MSTDPKYFNTNKLAQQTVRARGGATGIGALMDKAIIDPETGKEGVSRNTGGKTPVGEMFYTDGSDAMANKGFVVGFHHVPSGKEIYLKAFMTAYNETFSPDWAEEKVYGRADPIYLFKQTTRVITVGIKVPAASAGEAFENLSRIQSLAQFLYPTYTDVQSASTISQSPLIRLQVMNLAQNQSSSPLGAVSFDTNMHVADAAHGLLGVLRNLSIVHNLEGQDGVIEYGGGGVLPKLIDINFDFAVIHEHALGWTPDPHGGLIVGSQGTFSNPGFPYGVRMGGAKTPTELQDLERENARAFSRPQREQRENETLEEAPEERLANIQARYANLLQSTGLGFRAGDIGLQARGGLGVGILEEATLDAATGPAYGHPANIFTDADLEILTGPGVPMTFGREEDE